MISVRPVSYTHLLLMVDQLCEKEENGRDEPEKEAVLNRMVIEQLMELLDEREQNLIRCRYFENRTQSETAKELGMTQVPVSYTHLPEWRWLRLWRN